MGEERRGKEERIIPGSQDHLPNYSLCKHIQTSKREREEKGGKNERQCEERKEEKETWKERKKGTKEGCKDKRGNRKKRSLRTNEMGMRIMKNTNTRRKGTERKL